MTDPTNTNDIDALLRWCGYSRSHSWHAALTALVAERDALQAKVKEHAEDRRKYIDAWADWIEANAGLEIDQWLRVYADAVPIPSPDGDEAKQRIFKHIDQRMRDASDAIDALRQRVAELEAQPPADRDLRERLVCAIWPVLIQQWREYKDAIDPRGDARSDALVEADKMLAEMRKGDSDGK